MIFGELAQYARELSGYFILQRVVAEFGKAEDAVGESVVIAFQIDDQAEEMLIFGIEQFARQPIGFSIAVKMQSPDGALHDLFLAGDTEDRRFAGGYREVQPGLGIPVSTQSVWQTVFINHLLFAQYLK